MQTKTIATVGYAVAGLSTLTGVIDVYRIPNRLPPRRINMLGAKAYVLSVTGFCLGISLVQQAGWLGERPTEVSGERPGEPARSAAIVNPRGAL